ncbi:hypothetical protein SAPIO_CDS0718 [Scedosporium apiospermum]|uniref:Major facilitator superfamily (MFS) profile domain-containing protein n=1 Tax=Pseudallescheria apiosperma TaxID=563466 RepID=A0A084GGD8_PSEDA|nr:uncharacterized protein SAPIO_CDS0718 [Scedosporium apiospermum]KEZ46400.1 hypothetical protein SAPIO_CDS0718 [Scedosporium apiospermum]
MIRSYGSVEETQISYYAGLMIAVFTFCEFLSGMLWAKLSDRIGRKPALLIGSFCGIVTALALGFSKSISLAVASRAFGGLFNPNVGLAQTCVVESVPEKDEQAEGDYELVDNGQPELQALRRAYGAPSIHELEDISVDKEFGDHLSPPVGEGRAVAFTAQVIFQIVSVSLLALHKVSSDAVMPTFLAISVASNGPESSPRRNLLQYSGGFGYGNYEIGLILLSQAVVAVVTQATVVPLFINRMGPLRAYRVILCVYPTIISNTISEKYYIARASSLDT